MPIFARLLTALLALFVFAAPAMAASNSGTHAWSRDVLRLHNGPGTNYTQTGEILADLPIMVLRCQKLWCLVDGDAGRGWTYKRNVDFGKGPDVAVRIFDPTHVSGPVCFYTGANYTGTEFCPAGGRTIRDLALLGMDNTFASVRLTGSASVSACRDRDFQSYCELIVASQPALDQYLYRNLSSIRVH